MLINNCQGDETNFKIIVYHRKWGLLILKSAYCQTPNHTTIFLNHSNTKQSLSLEAPREKVWAPLAWWVFSLVSSHFHKLDGKPKRDKAAVMSVHTSKMSTEAMSINWPTTRFKPETGRNMRNSAYNTARYKSKDTILQFYCGKSDNIWYEMELYVYVYSLLYTSGWLIRYLGNFRRSLNQIAD